MIIFLGKYITLVMIMMINLQKKKKNPYLPVQPHNPGQANIKQTIF